MSFDKKQSTSYSYSKQGVDGVGPMVVHILYIVLIYLLNNQPRYYIKGFSTSSCKRWPLCITGDSYSKKY
jgi:hypothetical protein